MARRLPEQISRIDFDKLVTYLKRLLESHYHPRLKNYSKTGQKIRQYMIAIAFGFGSGMRISEVCGLSLKQKYLYQTKEQKTKGEEAQLKILESNIPALTPERIDDNYVKIISGKGQKDRVVPLPKNVFKSMGISREELLRNLPLKVSYRSTQKFITDIGRKVLNKHITFHMLRHGFITELLNLGMPMHQVQVFSGHSRIETLGIYAHSSPAQALEKYEEIF